jgi:hypothetical protein
MMKCVCACMFGMLLFACNKKEPAMAERVGVAATNMAVDPECAKEIITKAQVKVGETGIVLPVGSKLCFSKDNLEIRVELPTGYNFLSNKTLPVYGTYACYCSASSACQVFYAEGLGFGCLQSSCSGSCTGKFTYHGYSVDRIIAGKSDFFNLPEVQKEIAAMQTTEAWSKQSVYGVSFFIVNDEKKFMAAGATCNCEGTQACKLKTINMLGKKIYFCEGACNGCELTV